MIYQHFAPIQLSFLSNIENTSKAHIKKAAFDDF